MSAVGATFGKAVGALGGPQLAAILVAGGLVAGALTGGLIAGPLSSGVGGTSTGQLSIYACPGVGPALQTVPAGQRFLVTGRSEDGTWARIHYPQPGRAEAWVQVSPLTFQASLDSVPVATCAPVVAIAGPSLGPGSTLTAIQDNSPSPGPTPSSTPTSGGSASLTKLSVSTGKISYDEGAYCPTAARKATFSVKGGGGSGLVGVTLFWRAPGAGSYAQSPMSLAAGTASSGTWQVALDTTTNGLTSAGKLTFYAVGKTPAGATSRIPRSGSDDITVAVCANTGPTITSASSSSGSTLRWDPLGVGSCQTATTISAAITVPSSVALFCLNSVPCGRSSGTR